MPDNKKYQIETTRPEPYLDDLGKVVQGFTVTVKLTEFDELQEIQVSSLSPEIVKPIIEKLLSDREALRDLG